MRKAPGEDLAPAARSQSGGSHRLPPYLGRH